MATGGVHDDDLVFVLPEVSDTSFGDLNRVSLILVTIEGALDLGSIHLQLSECTCTECISAHNADFPAFFHIVIGELCASRGLTCTLKTNEHNNVGAAALELVRLVL